MPESAHTRIVLASASPRRRRLMSWLELPFETTHVETPEDLNTPLASDPPALACSLAEEKAHAARATGHFDDALLLTFDTIVVLDSRVLGKPLDATHGREMLHELSGRTHHVVTGCALQCPGAEKPSAFAVTTNVQMHDLSERDIEAWMERGEYLGCAGAYNIEAQVAAVTTTECHQNVAGLPLCHLAAALRGDLPGVRRPECIHAVPASPVATCDKALRRSCKLGPRVIR